MKHKYQADDLRAMFEFCHNDFGRFLNLLTWMDTLTDQEAGDQIAAAKRLRELR